MFTVRQLSKPWIGTQRLILVNCRKITSNFSIVDAENLQLPKPVRLKGRSFLPDSEKESFPSFLNGPDKHFPLALQARGSKSIEEWGRLCREQIDAKLLKYGAILFRQLPMSSVEDFQKFVRVMDFPRMEYDCGSGHRASLADQIYSASDEPPQFSIELHNELAYMPNYNRKIFFCCLIPSNIGGETAICKNSDLIGQLDEKYLKKIKEKKIRYIRQCRDKSLCDYISWQQVFNTDSKQVAETKMKEIGFHWEWSSNNNLLKFWLIRDAFEKHHITGKETWFNQLHAMHNTYFKAHPDFQNIEAEKRFFPNHTTYGDGEEFEPEFLEQIRAEGWRKAVGVSWCKGDFMVLDNMSVQHARLGYEGRRKIAVALLN